MLIKEVTAALVFQCQAGKVIYTRRGRRQWHSWPRAANNEQTFLMSSPVGSVQPEPCWLFKSQRCGGRSCCLWRQNTLSSECQSGAAAGFIYRSVQKKTKNSLFIHFCHMCEPITLFPRSAKALRFDIVKWGEGHQRTNTSESRQQSKRLQTLATRNKITRKNGQHIYKNW